MIYATELSPGNWFTMTNNKAFRRIKEVNGKTGMVLDTYNLYFETKDMLPVRITPDILANVGFEVDIDDMYADYIYDDNIFINYYFHEGIVRVYFKRNNNKELYAMTPPGIIYIHQLQNFLSLCFPNTDFINKIDETKRKETKCCLNCIYCEQDVATQAYDCTQGLTDMQEMHYSEAKISNCKLFESRKEHEAKKRYAELKTEMASLERDYPNLTNS